MKKLLITAVVALCLATTMHAEVLPAKFDAASRHALSMHAKGPRALADNSTLAAFVSIADGADARFLEDYGLEISREGSVAIVRGTKQQLLAASADGRVLSLSMPRRLDQSNNISRAVTGADRISTAPGIDGTTYTGAGVITGLFDNGFDMHNPTFRRNGRSRVSRMWHYSDENGACTEYANPELIDLIVTDNADNHHGSHVLGTIAGSHPDYDTYNGVATDAELAIACGPLYDANIADGVARIAGYARSEGKPCVINLSISDFIGPRDGTDPFSRALADATSASGDAILVVSAGNYNTEGKSFSRILSPDDPALRTFVLPEMWINKGMGVLSVWSGDSRPLKLKLVMVESRNGEDILAEFDVPADPEQPLFIATSELNDYYDVEFINDPSFDSAYVNSFVAAYYDGNESTNGRPCYYLEFQLEINREFNTGSRRAIGIIAEGAEGQRVDMTLSTDYLQLHGLWVKGWSNGADELSISSMAAADGAVCVGAWVSRPVWSDLNGNEQTMYGDYVYTEGDIAPWSSRGVLVDGRTLPHTAAPGAALISVLSTPYMAQHPDNFAIVAQHESAGRTDYWAAEYGTSMSAPVVAGAIALWLEADPSLTAYDVLDIIATTSRNDAFTENDTVAWGAGKFDAEAGLREVLNRRSALAGPSAVGEHGISAKRISENLMDVSLPGAEFFTAELYDLSGRAVASVKGVDGCAQLPVGGLAKGVYLVRAGRHCLKCTL